MKLKLFVSGIALTASLAAHGAHAQLFQAPAKAPATCNAAPTLAGVQACQTQLLARTGGGTILLPAGTIPFTAPFTLASGVSVKGVPVQLTFINGITETGWTAAGGTVIACTGGNTQAIIGNTSSNSSPDANFLDDAISNVQLEDMFFSGCANALAFGGHNHAGLMYARLRNLWAAGGTAGSYAFDLINFHHLDVNRLEVNNVPAASCGDGIRFMQDLPAATLQEGNSFINNIVYQGYSGCRTNHGISVWATNNGLMDLIDGARWQVITFRSGTPQSQAATMANTSTAITVTDGTKWVVGEPVTTNITANGFIGGQTYVILSTTGAGNVVTLGNKRNGSAIAATGNTAVNLITSGMPHLDIWGDAGSSVNNLSLRGLDLEGHTQTSLYIENSVSSRYEVASFAGLTQGSEAAMVLRNVSTTQVSNGDGQSYDSDSGNSAYITGQWYSSLNPATVLRGSYYWQLRGVWCLNQDGSNSNGCSSELRYPSGGFVYPLRPTGDHIQATGNNNFTLSALYCGYVKDNSGTAGPFTLPSIGSGQDTNSFQGCHIRYYNDSSKAKTFTTSSSQRINDVLGLTSVVIPAFTHADFTAYSTGDTPWWDLTIPTTFNRGFFDLNTVYVTPTTGATVTIAAGTSYENIDPAGPLAALTVAYQGCTSDNDTQVFSFSISQVITTLTLTAASGTISNPPASPTLAGMTYKVECHGANTTFYPRS